MNRLLWLIVIVLIAGTSRADEPAMTLQEYQDRIGRLEEAGIDDRIELAAAATELGRIDDADALYRQVLAIDPAHDVAYNALWILRRGHQLPVNSEAYRDARERLPKQFVEHTTSRYVIFSDANPQWVVVQGRRLERACDRFIRFANSMSLRPLPLRHKLVAVVFAQRNAFAQFAGPDGNGDVSRVAGYYSPRHDRLVFYHVESNANVATARASLERMQSEIDAIRRSSRRQRRTSPGEARAMEDELDSRLAHLDEQERRLNLFAIQQSISVTVHEAIHQLMFHSGVQSPKAPHPLWIVEGLAVAFETDDPRSAFGPFRDYQPRREAFWHLMDSGRLLPLRRLVGIQPANMDGDRNVEAAIYNQSFALVSWLVRKRKPQLKDYLERLNVLPPIPLTGEDHVALFEQSFGDIDRLERAWLRDEE